MTSLTTSDVMQPVNIPRRYYHLHREYLSDSTFLAAEIYNSTQIFNRTYGIALCSPARSSQSTLFLEVLYYLISSCIWRS